MLPIELPSSLLNLGRPAPLVRAIHHRTEQIYAAISLVSGAIAC